MSKKTEVATRTQTAVAVQNGRARGLEEPIAKEDLIIPRAKLFQGLPTEYEQYPDAKPGQIINSITKEVLPAEFVPVFKFTNWVRFNERDTKSPAFDPAFEAGAIIWRSTDPHDPKVIAEGAFGPNGEPPLATKFLNFFAMFPGVPMPVVISFSKTSFKAGRQLLSIAQFSGGDLFSRMYKLGSKLEKSDQYSYYVLTVNQAGMVEGDLFQKAEKLYEEFADRPIKVDEEQPEGETKLAF